MNKIKWNYSKKNKEWWTGKLYGYAFRITKQDLRYRLVIELHGDFTLYEVFTRIFNSWTYARQFCQILIDDARLEK